MDNLTHSAIGLFLSRIGLGRWSPRGTAIVVLAANIPDIDVVASAGGALNYLDYHRNLTHSLLLMPVMALAAVAIVRLVGRKPVKWAWAFFAALIAVGLASRAGLDQRLRHPPAASLFGRMAARRHHRRGRPVDLGRAGDRHRGTIPGAAGGFGDQLRRRKGTPSRPRLCLVRPARWSCSTIAAAECCTPAPSAPWRRACTTAPSPCAWPPCRTRSIPLNGAASSRRSGAYVIQDLNLATGSGWHARHRLPQAGPRTGDRGGAAHRRLSELPALLTVPAVAGDALSGRGKRQARRGLRPALRHTAGARVRGACDGGFAHAGDGILLLIRRGAPQVRQTVRRLRSSLDGLRRPSGGQSRSCM